MKRQTKRRLSRRRSWKGRVLLAFIVVLVATGLPTSSFESGSLARPSLIPIAVDNDAVLSLNVTSELKEGQSNCLVRVTNKFGISSVTVEVSLRNDSIGFGDLKNPDTPIITGDTVTFPLANGETKTVKMDVLDNTNGSVVYFHTNSTASGFRASAMNRTAPIGAGGGIDPTCV